MQIELRELQRELGITFLFVTHDQEEALSLSDRIGVMEHGKILQIAEPKTLYERPASREVADFIGLMNFFEGRVVTVYPSVVEVEIAGSRLGIEPDGQAHLFRAGDRITVAIRPEKISLAPAMERALLQGHIAAISYLGDRQQLQVTVPGAATTVTVVAPSGASPLRAGDDVALHWPPNAPVLLPAQ
jgi:spermidine/putrescine transport system ATP-binding protein/putrescine transport system ATP-binding protein